MLMSLNRNRGVMCLSFINPQYTYGVSLNVCFFANMLPLKNIMSSKFINSKIYFFTNPYALSSSDKFFCLYSEVAQFEYLQERRLS